MHQANLANEMFDNSEIGDYAGEFNSNDLPSELNFRYTTVDKLNSTKILIK
jgi:hypothetical protein